MNKKQIFIFFAVVLFGLAVMVCLAFRVGELAAIAALFLTLLFAVGYAGFSLEQGIAAADDIARGRVYTAIIGLTDRLRG